MSYDCEICGYIQNDKLYECIRKQRYEEHLKSHNHKLKILLSDTNAIITMKKCRDVITNNVGQGCIICDYYPSEHGNYKFLMNRHILTKNHIVKVNAHNNCLKDASLKIPVERKNNFTTTRAPITQMDFIPNILISRPANISTYKEQLKQLQNDGEIYKAELVQKKIESVEHSLNLFKTLPKPSTKTIAQ